MAMNHSGPAFSIICKVHLQEHRLVGFFSAQPFPRSPCPLLCQLAITCKHCCRRPVIVLHAKGAIERGIAKDGAWSCTIDRFGVRAGTVGYADCGLYEL